MHTPPTFYKGLKVGLKIQNAGQNEATRSRPGKRRAEQLGQLLAPTDSASQTGAPGTAPQWVLPLLCQPAGPWTCPGVMAMTTQGGKEAGPRRPRAAVVNETSPLLKLLVWTRLSAALSPLSQSSQGREEGGICPQVPVY